MKVPMRDQGPQVTAFKLALRFMGLGEIYYLLAFNIPRFQKIPRFAAGGFRV